MPGSDEPRGDTHPSSESIPTDRRTPEDLDAVFACLAHQRRRLLIECLSENPGPIVVEEVVRYISERDDVSTTDTLSNETPAELTITLLHSHLPKMADAGVIEVEHETNTIREGYRFDLATSLLEVV